MAISRVSQRRQGLQPKALASFDDDDGTCRSIWWGLLGMLSKSRSLSSESDESTSTRVSSTRGNMLARVGADRGCGVREAIILSTIKDREEGNGREAHKDAIRAICVTLTLTRNDTHRFQQRVTFFF